MRITHGFYAPDVPLAVTIGNFDGLSISGIRAMIEPPQARSRPRARPAVQQ
jgi:hypothetical protein